MKKLLCLALLSIGFISANAATLTIINHYPAPLVFHIEKGQNFIPGLPTTFTLGPNTKTPAISVLGSLAYCEPVSATVFIHFQAQQAKNGLFDNGLFGVGRGCESEAQQNTVYANPDTGRGVAMNPDNGENATIIICANNGQPCQ